MKLEVRPGVLAARWLAFLLLAGFVFETAAQERNSPGAAPAEARVALVIGNSAYKDAPLANPVNDAVDMADALRDAGFKVILRRNATTREMRQAIREFGNELRKAEVGLFYFAGHGIQVRGANYLVPVGAEIGNEADAEDEAIDANYALRTMEEAQAKVSILILDACRNNPFQRGFRSASRGLAQMSAATGSLIAFATAPGSVAADGSGRNGLYTKHLLDNLRHPDTDILKVFQRTRAGVVRETGGRQTPWESTSLVGDFFFRAPASGTQVASIAAAGDRPAPTVSSIARHDLGTLAISSRLPGAEIFLDGSRVGEAHPGREIVVANLAAGRHRVLARKDARTWDYTVEVVPNQRTQMSVGLAPRIAALDEGIFREVVAAVSKSYVREPDLAAMLRGAVKGLEQGALKGRLTMSDGPEGVALAFAEGGAPARVLLGKAGTAPDLQRELLFVAALARELDPSAEGPRIDEALLHRGLEALDPHSGLLGASAFNELKVGATGVFGGVAMEVGTRDRLPIVVAPIEGTPASRAGVAAGDRIVAIDGDSMRDVSLADVVKRLRGATGSRLTLSIQRDGWPGTRDIPIVREIIRVQSVTSRELEPGIGYVRIAQFSQQAPDQMRQVLEKWSGGILGGPAIRGLVLDLRNNPGGLLSVALDVAGHFLPDGQLVITTDGRLSESRQRYVARTKGPRIPVPMVVLVNEGSASASELLAGALQDHRRAVVVGTRTFGQGSVQTLLPLSGGQAIKLTTAEYRSPKGRGWNGLGLDPDVLVSAPPSSAPSTGADDPQLKAAVETLKAAIGGG